MTARIESLWRYPVKAHGREQIDQAALIPGQGIPWDRTWAVAHDASDADGATWAQCSNFTRGAKAPGLQAITCTLNEADETITFTQPDLGTFTGHPERDAAAFIAWSAPLVPKGRAMSARIVRAAQHGMTDFAGPSITLCNHASHKTVAQKAGTALSIHRWRGNVWIDGLAPWEEFEWVGRDVQIGEATLHVEGPTTRCLSTHANPETGRRDVPILDVLEEWGHRNFSVIVTVAEPGTIRPGDTLRVL